MDSCKHRVEGRSGGDGLQKIEDGVRRARHHDTPAPSPARKRSKPKVQCSLRTEGRGCTAVVIAGRSARDQGLTTTHKQQVLAEAAALVAPRMIFEWRNPPPSSPNAQILIGLEEAV